jgi:hypothetical protein
MLGRFVEEVEENELGEAPRREGEGEAVREKR